MKSDNPSPGLDAWLPTKEQTEEFYKCVCNDPSKRVCYWPGHPTEKQARVLKLMDEISDLKDKIQENIEKMGEAKLIVKSEVIVEAEYKNLNDR